MAVSVEQLKKLEGKQVFFETTGRNRYYVTLILVRQIQDGILAGTWVVDFVNHGGLEGVTTTFDIREISRTEKLCFGSLKVGDCFDVLPSTRGIEKWFVYRKTSKNTATWWGFSTKGPYSHGALMSYQGKTFKFKSNRQVIFSP